MKTAPVVCFCVLFLGSGSVSAAPAEEQQCVVRPHSPADKCKAKGGKWKDGLCFIFRTKVRYKTQVETKTLTNTKTIIIREPTIKIIHVSAPQSVSQSVEVGQVQKAVVAVHRPAPAKAKAKQDDPRWWWVGPGVFVLGLWAGERDFIVGGEGKIVFAINDRFRVSGLAGAGLGPWQESKPNILIGAEGSVRLWKWLFLSAGLETVWGGLQGLSVHRRLFLGALGPDFWISDHFNISLHFVFGTRDDVTSCKTDLGRFTGGNLLQLNLYF